MGKGKGERQEHKAHVLPCIRQVQNGLQAPWTYERIPRVTLVLSMSANKVRDLVQALLNTTHTIYGTAKCQGCWRPRNKKWLTCAQAKQGGRRSFSPLDVSNLACARTTYQDETHSLREVRRSVYSSPRGANKSRATRGGNEVGTSNSTQFVTKSRL